MSDDFVKTIEGYLDQRITAHKMAQILSVDNCQPASVFCRYRNDPEIPVFTVESCTGGPTGFRKVLLLRSAIEFFQKKNLKIGAPKSTLPAPSRTTSILDSEMLDLRKELLEEKKRRFDAENKLAFLTSKPANKLLSRYDIFSMRRTFTALCGVYFLINDGEIVYVGQSVNIYARVGSHQSIKKFDSFSYIECKKEELNSLETKYIHYFRPKLNININGRLVMSDHDTATALRVLEQKQPQKLI